MLIVILEQLDHSESVFDYKCNVLNPTYHPIASTVNGGWGCWGEWGECSASCGKGIKQRYRECTSPLPLNEGQDCTGSNVEEAACDGVDCLKPEVFDCE